MRLYTRSGDEGHTSVIGAKVAKDDDRVEAYGTIDELNCFVGQAVSSMADEKWTDMREALLEVQHELFDCGSDLAYAKWDESKAKVSAEMTLRLEQWIDEWEGSNPEITKFILPGGSMTASLLHVCRTVTRRAERAVVTLSRHQAVNPEVGKYINRLSDLFFAAARAANVRDGVHDIEYARSAEVFKK